MVDNFRMRRHSGTINPVTGYRPRDAIVVPSGEPDPFCRVIKKGLKPLFQPVAAFPSMCRVSRTKAAYPQIPPGVLRD
jgi:hypothetical protein